MKKKLSSGSDSLREKAEKHLKENTTVTPSKYAAKCHQYKGMSEADALKLIHELEVNQIELEMQNEELRLAKKEAEDIAASKFADLYDFTPMAYFVLSKDGEIIALNLSGAKMLGKNRSAIQNTPLVLYISDESKPIFKSFLDKVMNCRLEEKCDIRMLTDNNLPEYLHLVGVMSKSADACQLAAIDISERIKAETLLFESEVRYLDLFENSLMAISIVKPDGSLVHANKAYAIMYGFESVEKLKSAAVNVAGFYAQTMQRDKILDIIKHAGEFQPIEVEVIKKDGSHFFVLVTATVIKDKAGNPVFYQANHIDITQRKQMEQELLFRNVVLTAQQQASIDGILIVDEKGSIVSCNQRFIEILDVPEELIKNGIDKPVLDFITNKVANPLSFSQRVQHLNAHKSESGNDEIVLKNGKIFERYSTPMLGPEQQYFGRVWYFRDISEKKLSESELLKLKAAIENSNVTIVITDKNGNIEYVNPYFSQLTGYSLNECKGENPRVLKSGYHSEVFYKELWDTILSGKTWEGELYNKKKNGDFYWENAIISPIRNNKNEITHFVAIKTDITAVKKNNEELIIAIQHAEESDRLKSAFLANMSHEIRTPMNGILGFTELLKEPKLSGKEQQAYIKIIEKSGARMLNTINDIMNISKVESGMVDVVISATNINEQLEYIYTFFKPEIEQKGLQLSYKKALSGEDAMILTDREKIYAILTNLVKNAIKFTQKGSIEFGYLLKPTDNRVVGTNELEFYVKDTGVGIPLAQKEFIFERFRQGSESLSRNYEGTGLGLSISKAYVEMLGGKIRLETAIENVEEGKSGGSAFYFTIPYLTVPDKINEMNNMPIEKLPIHQFKNLKILIVDDDEISRMFIKLALKSFGKIFLEAETGAQAIEACRHHSDIDMVMMDMKMPVMDGYDATRQIRRISKEIIIIAQTAFALSTDRDKAIEAGCKDFIAKPYSAIALKTLLSKYF